MIHLLEIGPETDPRSLKKKCRNLAMTGGFEVALVAGLSPESLAVVVDKFIPELLQDGESASRRRASTCFRVLSLAAAHPNCSAESRLKIEQLLN